MGVNVMLKNILLYSQAIKYIFKGTLHTWPIAIFYAYFKFNCSFTDLAAVYFIRVLYDVQQKHKQIAR